MSAEKDLPWILQSKPGLDNEAFKLEEGQIGRSVVLPDGQKLMVRGKASLPEPVRPWLSGFLACGDCEILVSIPPSGSNLPQLIYHPRNRPPRFSRWAKDAKNIRYEGVLPYWEPQPAPLGTLVKLQYRIVSKRSVGLDEETILAATPGGRKASRIADEIPMIFLYRGSEPILFVCGGLVQYAGASPTERTIGQAMFDGSRDGFDVSFISHLNENARFQIAPDMTASGSDSDGEVVIKVVDQESGKTYTVSMRHKNTRLVSATIKEHGREVDPEIGKQIAYAVRDQTTRGVGMLFSVVDQTSGETYTVSTRYTSRAGLGRWVVEEITSRSNPGVDEETHRRIAALFKNR